MNDEIFLDKNLEISNTNLQEEQNSFLQSSLGQAVNFAVDTGLRALLPDMIENEVIDIKNTFVNEGFSEAINQVVQKACDVGKSILGIFTGNFESISQAQKAVEKGGLLDGISDAIDFTLDKAKKSGLLSKNISKIIKDGKNVLLDNVSSGIKKEFEDQTKNIEKLETYTKNWQESFENENLKDMEKYIIKIKSTLEKVLPLEKLITEARKIENMHELIKNNGGNFNLDDDELELANILA